MLPNFSLQIDDCQQIMIYCIIYPVLQYLIHQLPLLLASMIMHPFWLETCSAFSDAIQTFL